MIINRYTLPIYETTNDIITAVNVLCDLQTQYKNSSLSASARKNIAQRIVERQTELEELEIEFTTALLNYSIERYNVDYLESVKKESD